MRSGLQRCTVAVALLVALGACTQPGAGVSPERLSAVARDVIHGQETVTAEALSDWIIQGRADFVLFDIRSQRAFNAGHIQGAKNVPLSYLVEPPTLAELPADRRVVLYDDGDGKAAQAAVMLRMVGRNVSYLEGGYAYWDSHIARPTVAALADKDEQERQKRIAVACYFSGNYRSAAAGGSPAFTPALMPVDEGAAAQTSAPVRKKKRKPLAEGC